MCEQMGAEQPSHAFVLRSGLSPTTTFCSVSGEHHRGMIQTRNVSQRAALHLMPLREFNQGNDALTRLRRSPPCCCCCCSVVVPEEASEVRNISCESKYRKSQRHEKRRRNTKETSVCGWDNKDFMQPIHYGQGWQTKAFTINIFPSYCSDCEFIMLPAFKAQTINVAKTQHSFRSLSSAVGL